MVLQFFTWLEVGDRHISYNLVCMWKHILLDLK